MLEPAPHVMIAAVWLGSVFVIFRLHGGGRR